MGGNRQKKSSSSGFFSKFNIFPPKKSRGGHYDAPQSWRHSDYDKGICGVAEPNIDKKAEDFIAKIKQHVSDSALYQVDPPAENA